MGTHAFLCYFLLFYYSLTSSTLTLSGAPGSGEEVVVHIVSDLISGQSLVRNNFTGVTNQTDFYLRKSA